MGTIKIIGFDEDGNAQRLKIRIARILDYDPVTGADKENIRDSLGVSPDATGLVRDDIGSGAGEVSVNQMLGSLAYQSAEAVSADKLEIESTTGTATTQALTVTDGSSTKFVVQEDGQTIVGGTTSSVSKFGSTAKGLTVRASTQPVLALNDTDSADYVGLFAQNGTGTYLWNYTAGNLYLGTNATTRVTIDSSGNITHKVSDGGANYDLTCNNHGAFGGSAVVDSRIRSENIGSSNAYASNLVFYTNNTSNVLTEAARFSEAGHLEFPSGQGIDFGSTTTGVNSPTVESGLLDDYEEGRLVVTGTPATSGTITLDTGNDNLSYTKVGRKVSITGVIVLSSVSSPVGNYISVSLPFEVANLNNGGGNVSGSCFIYNAAGNSGDYSILALEGQTYFRIYKNTASSSVATAADFSGDEIIYIGLTYFAA